jgi:hypothetical protein
LRRTRPDLVNGWLIAAGIAIVLIGGSYVAASLFVS